MSTRKGDWRDLLTAHSLAVDAKKLLLGFVAMLVTFILLGLMGVVYGRWFGYRPVACLGDFEGGNNVLFWLMSGRGILALRQALPLFNPFAAGILHFAMSILSYLLLLWVWTFYGGAISRLTALQYARDEIPTLHEATEMADKKRKAFFFAPLAPLFGVVVFGICNILVGLVGSIPYIGPWLDIFLVPIFSIAATVVIVFVAVLGLLSFGLMMPAISIGGKDAFEGWSSAYSYVLWGFNRWICYSLLALVIGAVTTLAAWAIGELFIYILASSVDIGMVGSKHLLVWAVLPAGDESLWEYFLRMGPVVGPIQASGFEGVGLTIASSIAACIALFVRIMVFAYAASYFFTANTIICFLLRKHVDRIDIEEIYEEEAEEEPAEQEAAEEPKAEEVEPQQEPQEQEEEAEQEEESEDEDE